MHQTEPSLYSIYFSVGGNGKIWAYLLEHISHMKGWWLWARARFECRLGSYVLKPTVLRGLWVRWISFCDSGLISSGRSAKTLLKVKDALAWQGWCFQGSSCSRVVGQTKEVLSWLCIPVWAAPGEEPGGRQRWWCHFLVESHRVYHVITSGQSRAAPAAQLHTWLEQAVPELADTSGVTSTRNLQ